MGTLRMTKNPHLLIERKICTNPYLKTVILFTTALERLKAIVFDASVFLYLSIGWENVVHMFLLNSNVTLNTKYMKHTTNYGNDVCLTINCRVLETRKCLIYSKHFYGNVFFMFSHHM